MNVKLTTQNMTTRGNTQWQIGVKQSAKQGELKLCSNTCLHYYDDPLLAVLLNSIHANIHNPCMFEVEVSKPSITDGLKYGCKEQTLLKEIPLPSVTVNQRTAFAILCSLEVYTDKAYVKWAKAWLSGKDRTTAYTNAAYAAYNAAYAAYNAAAAYTNAAYAAYAAYNAAYAAYNVAAADATDATYNANAAYDAARATAYAAAYAADAAGNAAKKINFKAIAKKALAY